MRKYMESGVYVLYFVCIIGLGLVILSRSRKGERRFYALFGLACLILGCGDAFHLFPRSVGLFLGTLDHPGARLAFWLGIGKLVTSITMTLFYVLLCRFLFARAGMARQGGVWAVVLLLAALRIALCCFPQNGWTTNNSPLSWGIYRNLPFTALGICTIVLAWRYLRKTRRFRLLWLAIVLSFGFYIPVVLFAGTHPWTGALMLPKTLCYLWIALMGYRDQMDILRIGRDCK